MKVMKKFQFRCNISCNNNETFYAILRLEFKETSTGDDK